MSNVAWGDFSHEACYFSFLHNESEWQLYAPGHQVIIGSDNVLWPIRHLLISSTTNGWSLIGPYDYISLKFDRILTNFIQENELQMLFAKWRPLCFDPDVLTELYL